MVVRAREAQAVQQISPTSSPVDRRPFPAEDGSSAGAGTAGDGPAQSGAIGGREQALRQLAEIAGWFKRNEPNSPLGYTLDEAVRRGRMAWPDLVAELISTPSDVAAAAADLTRQRRKRVNRHAVALLLPVAGHEPVHEDHLPHVAVYRDHLRASE